jgi:predicted nuclease with TOPRIM domain
LSEGTLWKINNSKTTTEEEEAMDVKDFCSGMEMELTAWKAKLYDTWRKFDKLGTAEREKIQPKIEDLHMIVEELSGRLEQLKVECPTDWSPIKKDIDKGHVDMRSKYEETMEEIGKSSPVSIAG